MGARIGVGVVNLYTKHVHSSVQLAGVTDPAASTNSPQAAGLVIITSLVIFEYLKKGV